MHAVALALLLAAEMIPKGAPGRSIAVLEFESQLQPGDAVDRTYFSDQVRGALIRNLPEARVMTRENLLQLIGAAGKKLEDCTGECEVETGRLLGADLVVSGRLVKVGARFKLSLRLHDTRTGALVSTATAGGETVEKLDDATGDAVADLVATFAPPATARPPARGGGEAGPPPTLLIVESLPSHARVLVDGRERGTAPLSVEVTPGRHQLRLELEDHQPADREVEVRLSQTSKERVQLTRLLGRLEISSEQAVKCEAGGQSRAVDAGGLEQLQLPVGAVEVRCTASGYQPFSDRATVKAGQVVRVRARLDKEPEYRGPSRPGWPVLRTIGGLLLAGGGGYLIATSQAGARASMTLSDRSENLGTPVYAAALALGVLPAALASATLADDDLSLPVSLGLGILGGATTAGVLGLWYAGQDGAKTGAAKGFGNDHWATVGGAALAAAGLSLVVHGTRLGFDLSPDVSKPRKHVALYALSGLALAGLGGMVAAQRLAVAKENFVPPTTGDAFPSGSWIGLGSLGSLVGGVLAFTSCSNAHDFPWLGVGGSLLAGSALAALVSIDDWTFGVGMGMVGTGVGMAVAAVIRSGDSSLADNGTVEWIPTVFASRVRDGAAITPGIAGRF